MCKVLLQESTTTKRERKKVIFYCILRVKSALAVDSLGAKPATNGPQSSASRGTARLRRYFRGVPECERRRRFPTCEEGRGEEGCEAVAGKFATRELKCAVSEEGGLTDTVESEVRRR